MITGGYSFSANFTVNNYTYAVTPPNNLTIYDGSVANIPSIELINMPQESAVDSYYFLRVPTSSINSSL